MQGIKMRTSKTKQHINSSINCSSDQRSLERLGHACDRREHATIYLTASRGFTARTRHGCTSAAVLASRWLGPQHRGAGFPHPGLQMTAEDQPGREKPPSLDGGEKSQRRYQIPQISAALLEELHCLLHTWSLGPLPNTPTPASVL